jgi:hypothetical protein
MTVAEARRREDELELEELVLYLSAPEPRDVATITDPMAIYGTRPLDSAGIAAG